MKEKDKPVPPGAPDRTPIKNPDKGKKSPKGDPEIDRRKPKLKDE